ncbi:hypothetical protein HYW99_03995 [Candidatus Woesearchaeota archaeon]|nr:hypothetical protein [Candidatus Aenigmarchaeota archaeon]MBI2647614.1 hypothetical protein [Candidatus Woesearchaeota archaeon]
MSNKIKISLTVDEDKWTAFRKKCIDENIYYSSQVENLIEEWLKRK